MSVSNLTNQNTFSNSRGRWLPLAAGMFIFAGLAGTLWALLAGQVGPQAGAPEEVVTIPSAALIGGLVGVIGYIGDSDRRESPSYEPAL